MKAIIKGLLLIGLLFFLMQPALFAQNTGVEIIRIETRDGSVIMGRFVSENDQHLVLNVQGLGEVTIEIANIKRRTNIDPSRMRGGEYWPVNPQGTRYFFAPNAIGLKKGHGYYQNTWIFFNNVNYGVSDYFSIGGGIVPGFLLGGGIEATPMWVLPKFSLPVSKDNFGVAIGAMLGGAIGSGGGGLLYGSATLGNRDKNLTVGLGYGLADGDLSNTPLVNISGMYRSMKDIYLLTEVYFLPGIDGSGFGIFGARWAPGNFAADFGLLTPLASGTDIIGIPWLGVTLPFGR